MGDTGNLEFKGIEPVELDAEFRVSPAETTPIDAAEIAAALAPAEVDDLPPGVVDVDAAAVWEGTGALAGAGPGFTPAAPIDATREGARADNWKVVRGEGNVIVLKRVRPEPSRGDEMGLSGVSTAGMEVFKDMEKEDVEAVDDMNMDGMNMDGGGRKSRKRKSRKGKSRKRKSRKGKSRKGKSRKGKSRKRKSRKRKSRKRKSKRRN
jgi:hypothetical protein